MGISKKTKTSNGSTIGQKKVDKYFILYAMEKGIMKYYRFLQHEIKKYRGKKEQKTHSNGSASKDPEKGFLRPKIKFSKGKRSKSD